MLRSSVTALRRGFQQVSKRRFSAFSCLKQASYAQSSARTGLEARLPRAADISGRSLSESVFNIPLKRPDPFWLRDACSCEMCVDSSSKNKRFQTTDIPLEISYASEKVGPDGTVSVTWLNDIPGYGSNHVSTYSKDFLAFHAKTNMNSENARDIYWKVFWDKNLIEDSVRFIDFQDYMSHDTVLYDVLDQLRKYGILFLRNVPESVKAVEDIAGRIGPLKNTFYGLTWDVKSVPQPINVAYTHQHLGLHMDLLYTTNPPAWQLLHCLKNSCEGGTSMFCDSFNAARQLMNTEPDFFNSLLHHRMAFQYDNAGEFYYAPRPVIKKSKGGRIKEVNWSPPFQGPSPVKYGILNRASALEFTSSMKALKAFAALIEAPENIFEYRLREGECVLFDNRRILHARSAFDISSGERWLRGAYVDGDVMSSRYRVLHRTFGHGATSMPWGLNQ